MACGTLLIATGRDSIPELIKHGETGFIVQTTDEAIASLTQAPQLDRRSVGAHVAANFNRERMVNGYIQVYKQILER